jgi:hypothetical protein
LIEPALPASAPTTDIGAPGFIAIVVEALGHLFASEPDRGTVWMEPTIERVEASEPWPCWLPAPSVGRARRLPLLKISTAAS